MTKTTNSAFSDSIITPDVVQELEFYDDMAPEQNDVVKHQASDILRVSSLGKGSYCDVYLVVSRSTREQLAMKKLDKTKIDSIEDFLAAAPDLAIESHFLAKLDHPNIIKLRGTSALKFSDSFSEDSEGYFLTMDVMQETLKDRLQRWRNDPSCYKRRKGIQLINKSKKLDLRSMYGRLETVALGIAKAMNYLHQQDIVLRDLKPGNVGFHAETGKVCLFDFGFARGLANCSADEICGTPRYMAPEVLRGEGYSLKSDVYSFGVVLHELASLDKRKGSKKPSSESQPDLVDVCEALSVLSLNEIPCKEVTSLIEDCASDLPETRPSFEVVVELLSTILGGIITTESNASPVVISKSEVSSPHKPSVQTVSSMTLQTLPDYDFDDLCEMSNAEPQACLVDKLKLMTSSISMPTVS